MIRVRVDKQVLIETLAATVRAELAEAKRLAKETADAANHPEARPEGDKDTRKIELSYLAAGQAARASELESGLLLIATLPARRFGKHEPIQAGALVELDVEGKPQRVLLSPAGGGMKLADMRGTINVVTPQSPLGKNLLGRTIGDSFELVVAGQSREVEILSVA
ncbi:MAG TPA: GreA/GreB family elongation factor [Polyangiaceae bacterium]|jgi:transcription elongation GreA/GreB family factor